MKYSRTRLDRFISKHIGINKKDVRLLIAQGRVMVNQNVATRVDMQVGKFTHVSYDEKILQNRSPYYIMLNKPTGVVSATKDMQHQTVVDILPYDFKHELHIAGRLDLNSSGLLLLTNDGDWSERLSAPESKVTKRYRVKVEKPITDDYIDAFREGMYFSYEDITTQAVELKILSDHVAELSLTEGRYHQIKRMFGRFRNPVLELHRFAIGDITLDANLLPGESRHFNIQY